MHLNVHKSIESLHGNKRKNSSNKYLIKKKRKKDKEVEKVNKYNEKLRDVWISVNKGYTPAGRLFINRIRIYYFSIRLPPSPS